MGRFEILWLKFCKKKVILFPFGSDSYIYSELNDKTLQHALLSSQHHHLDDQNKIKKNKKLFFKYLDFYPASFQDNDSYIPKWSFVRPCFFCTNINKFKPSHKPKKDLVTIGHAPNHRGFKGTYFIQKAINELMDEGYKIEFLLIEGMEQDDLAKVFSEKVDILVDQIIFNGIAMCAIEGMSSGIPVIANLEETDTVLFLKDSLFLNECPIFSANIENIKDKIRELLDDENKRSTLGKLGREYVEKYHSPEAVSSDILKIIDSLQNNESLLNYYID